MPLQNFQYDTIMREYSRRQAQNHRILEEHIAEAYGKIPRLKEIDDEVATLSADKVRRLLNGEEKGTSDLKAAIQELSDERITLLVANGFPGDYLEMPYTCPDCQDTGYIGSRKLPVSLGMARQARGQPEGAAFARLAAGAGRAAHQLGDALGDGEAEAGAAVLARGRVVGLLKGVEQAR